MNKESDMFDFLILPLRSTIVVTSWKIKQSNPDPDSDAIGLPNWLPFLGGVGSVLALGFQILQGLVF